MLNQFTNIDNFFYDSVEVKQWQKRCPHRCCHRIVMHPHLIIRFYILYSSPSCHGNSQYGTSNPRRMFRTVSLLSSRRIFSVYWTTKVCASLTPREVGRELGIGKAVKKWIALLFFLISVPPLLTLYTQTNQENEIEDNRKDHGYWGCVDTSGRLCRRRRRRRRATN